MKSAPFYVYALLAAPAVAHDVRLTEEVLNLNAFIDGVDAAYQRTGVYPSSFRQLNVSAVCGAGLKGVRVEPPMDARISWRPKGCQYAYHIRMRGTASYVIYATDHRNTFVGAVPSKASRVSAGCRSGISIECIEDGPR